MRFLLTGFACAIVMLCSSRILAYEPCPTRIEFRDGQTSARLPGVIRKGNRLLFSLRLNGRNEDLHFVFDTGAGRAVINSAVARHFGLKPSEKSSLTGVGAGRTDVDVVRNVSLLMGDVRLEGVDLNMVDDVHESDGTAGIIGYALLCSSVVTLDYHKPSITVTAPAAFQYRGNGDTLPLSFKGKWPYVRGTLKVPGVDPVTDDFLVDTGSEDAVNHPIILQSKGPLRETNTGAGGFGAALKGVVGPNEWFRIGDTTIRSTTSVCCAGNEDVNRQLGGEILSHFRLIFNYPAGNMILEKYSEK